jgi:hypothetical protein
MKMAEDLRNYALDDVVVGVVGCGGAVEAA